MDEGGQPSGALPAIVAYWDADLQNQMANAAFVQWFGCTPEDAHGRHLREVIGERLYELNREHIAAVLTGEHRTFELAFWAVDGSAHHTVGSYIPDIADDGEVRGFYVLATDITERKLAEAQLADEKERIGTILDSVSEAVVSLDPALKVTHLNLAATTLTGLTRDEARGLPVDCVLPLVSEGRPPTLVDLCRQVEVSGEPVSVAVTDSLAVPGRPQVPVDYRITPVRTAAGGLSGVVVTLQDVTDSRALLVQIRERAQHDALTGLLNRNYLREQPWDTEGPTSVLFVDLDNFKEINDTCGHFAGDSALVEVAGVLAANVRPADEIIRLGGDEFVVVLRHCALRDAGVVAEALGGALGECRFTWGGQSFQLGASIGVACDSIGRRDIEGVIREADHACYVAKRAGGGTFALAAVSTEPAP